MLAGVGTRIVRMFGVELDALAGGIGRDGTVNLAEMVVDAERTCLTGLVFYRAHYIAGGID